MGYENWTFCEAAVRLDEHRELRQALGMVSASDFTTLYRSLLDGWGNAHMLAVTEGGREITFELTTVFGLPDQIAEGDAVAMQMLLDA
jgi:hypothetical protein